MTPSCHAGSARGRGRVAFPRTRSRRGHPPLRRGGWWLVEPVMSWSMVRRPRVPRGGSNGPAVVRPGTGKARPACRWASWGTRVGVQMAALTSLDEEGNAGWSEPEGGRRGAHGCRTRRGAEACAESAATGDRAASPADGCRTRAQPDLRGEGTPQRPPCGRAAPSRGARPAGRGRGWQSPSGSGPRSPRARAGRAGPSVRQVETSCPWPTAPAAACSRCSCGTTTTGQALVRTSVRPVEPSSSRLMLW